MKRKKHLALILACFIASQLIGCNADKNDIKSPNKETAIIENSDFVVEKTYEPIVSMDSTPTPTASDVHTQVATQSATDVTPTNQGEESIQTKNPNATKVPTGAPQGTLAPSVKPTSKPTTKPTVLTTLKPTAEATRRPTTKPTVATTAKPTSKPTVKPAATATPKPIPEITIYTCEDDVLHCWDEVKDEYVDLLEERIVYYLNLYRAEEGMAPATRLPGLSEYAALRAWQSENYICGSTKEGHVCEPFVCGGQGHNMNSIQVAAETLQYGEYVVPSEAAQALGAKPYWTAYDMEAYCQGACPFNCYSIDNNAKGIVGLFRDSSRHWSYLGDDYYRYVGVGISPNGHDLILTVSEFDDNHISYHKTHNPAYTYPDNPNYETCFNGCHCDEYN